MLQEYSPDLWNEYRHVQRSITAWNLNAPFNKAVLLRRLELPESLAGTYTPVGVYAMATLANSIMIKELDVLKKLIRRQPGFDRFQLRPTDSELRGLARYGPVAISNVTHVGSDALLITENNIQVLPLPQLVLRDLQEHVSWGMGRNRSRRHVKIVSIDGSSNITEEVWGNTQARSMRWIWDVAVRPVLGQLELLWQHRPPPVLTRLWWVGGGLMALLPLHATGRAFLGLDRKSHEPRRILIHPQRSRPSNFLERRLG